MSKNIFGFAATNISRVVQVCERELSKDKVQIIAGRDVPANRRCYVVLGVHTIDSVRLRALSTSRATLVVVDSLPALERIIGIDVLDVHPVSGAWPIKRPRLGPLLRSLRGVPKNLVVQIVPDVAMEQLMESVRARGILDHILAAAKAMRPADRPHLHLCVARCVVGEISIKAVRRRALDGKVSDEIAETLTLALESDVAQNLGRAMLAHIGGADAAVVADEYDCEAGEVRFLCNHLKRKPTIKVGSAAQRGRQVALRRPKHTSKH